MRRMDTGVCETAVGPGLSEGLLVRHASRRNMTAVPPVRALKVVSP